MSAAGCARGQARRGPNRPLSVGQNTPYLPAAGARSERRIAIAAVTEHEFRPAGRGGARLSPWPRPHGNPRLHPAANDRRPGRDDGAFLIFAGAPLPMPMARNGAKTSSTTVTSLDAQNGHHLFCCCVLRPSVRVIQLAKFVVCHISIVPHISKAGRQQIRSSRLSGIRTGDTGAREDRP